jgi:hypothetical protein
LLKIGFFAKLTIENFQFLISNACLPAGKSKQLFKQKFKEKLRNNWHWFALALLAASFFIGTSSFNYLTQDGDYIKWLSPDETANYTFSKFYGQEGDMRIFERYNLYTEDIMHPRSFRSDYGKLKPVSFLGIILIYGKIVKLASYKVLPYLTPFFASLGIIFFYLLIKEVFNKHIGILSAFLLASFPPYIYYSARSMFHNVLFTVLLIIGLYFIVIAVASNSQEKRKDTNRKRITTNILNQIRRTRWQEILFMALGGGFIGLAIITRTSELIWIVPMLFILWIFNIKKIGITKLVIFIAFLLLATLPMFYWNWILYGNAYFGGYPEMNSSLIGITQTSGELVLSTAALKASLIKEKFTELKDLFFFFGFQPEQSIKMFYFYFVNMFIWIFWPAVFGGLLYYAKIKSLKLRHVLYLFSFLIITIILIFYYGSWGFHDNPDPKSITIGNSYTRYWLPIYLGTLPFVSYLIIYITGLLDYTRKPIKKDDSKQQSLFKSRSNRGVIIAGSRVLIIILIYTISIQFVLYGSEEGLLFAARQQLDAKQEWSRVIELTESNSTIITQYHDKLFFPERKVINGLFNDKNMVMLYSDLAGLLPVYYYNFTLPDKDFEYLNTRRLREVGLGIEEVEKITDDFTLYKLNPPAE